MNRIFNITKLARPGQIAPNLLDRQFGKGKWVYVGWENLRYWLETSPLANPYSANAQHRPERISVATRAEAISKYRYWLRGQIQRENPEVLAALREIKRDTVLVCWCAPHACHAEVVAELAARLREQDQAAEADKDTDASEEPTGEGE